MIFDKLKPNPDASPPRLSEAQTSEPSKPPRVLVSIPAKPEPNRRYPDGSTFDNVFDDIKFTGTVMGFNAKEGFYIIRYNDCDNKEIDKNELNILIVATNTTNLKYRSKVAKKRKTRRKTQRTANSALQLVPKPSARPYQPKSHQALGKDIATIKQAEMSLRPLIQAETIGTNTDSFTLHEPTVHVANAVIDPETGATLSLKQLLCGNNKMTWMESHSYEWARLTQGNGRVKGAGTCFFVEWKTKPKHITPTYLRPVCDIRPQKEKTHRIRIAVGGNKVVTEGDLSTPTSDLTTAKLHFNSTISTDGAKYACFDISNFCLETPRQYPRQYH